MNLMKLRRADVEARAITRGFRIEDVESCFVEEVSDSVWIVDVDHPSYPKASIPPEQQPLPTSGPGTELSKLLKRFGIEPTPTCACRAKAAEMDAWGADECEKPERIAEVVGVMRAEAEARGLPFLDVAGRLLVRRAIANARRNA